MKVIANRQMHGVYGSRLANEEFDVPHFLGTELLKLKLVRLADDYETKALESPAAAYALPITTTEPKIINKSRK